MTTSPKSGTGKRNPQTPVSFPGWKVALSHSRLPDATVERHQRAVLGDLKFCKQRHGAASIATALLYLEERQRQGADAPYIRAGFGSESSCPPFAPVNWIEFD